MKMPKDSTIESYSERRNEKSKQKKKEMEHVFTQPRCHFLGRVQLVWILLDWLAYKG